MAERENTVEKKKKPNWFVKTGARISRFMREMRSELKKVVWPTYKQVVNNSWVVIVMVVIVGIMIAAFDLVMVNGVNALVAALK